MCKRASALLAARLAMLLAALLAAGASFGLHPEPGVGRHHGSSVLECAHSANAAPEAHDCVACRAHRSLVFARASSQLSTPIASAPRRFVFRKILPRPGAPSRCEGRAPPALA